MINTLFFIIVERGKANEILKGMHSIGIENGTVLLAEGTAESKWLNTLGLAKTSKELILVAVDDEKEGLIHNTLLEKYKFKNNNTGIAISMPISKWMNGKKVDFQQGELGMHSIIIVVDRGLSADVVRAARTAGARGATVVHGRGAGVPEDTYFPIAIEPKKDIVIILTRDEQKNEITNAINNELNLERSASGVIFSLPVKRTSGLTSEVQR